jgi:hypothetical protein
MSLHGAAGGACACASGNVCLLMDDDGGRQGKGGRPDACAATACRSVLLLLRFPCPCRRPRGPVLRVGWKRGEGV